MFLVRWEYEKHNAQIIRTGNETVSEIMCINKQELIERAMHFYLASIHQELELEQELHAWDEVSDEALLNMEREMLQ
jgi:hypothetical protein